jgi:hypothetical protein
MGGIANKDGVTVESFSETLSPPVDAPSPISGPVVLKYIRKYYLEPGMYQIRVAARDPVTDELGSAWQLIQVPAKDAGKMWLSSIFLREQGSAAAPADVMLNLDAVSRARFSIQHRFTPDSGVRFFVNVHDAAGPDLLLRTTVFQGNQPVIQSPGQSIAASPGNVEQRLMPVTGMLTFRDLAPGSYTLEIEITDPASATKVTERIPFEIARTGTPTRHPDRDTMTFPSA